jgi:hypothetical protein
VTLQATRDMNVSFGQGRKHVTATAKQLTEKVGHQGCKLHMDNLFLLPHLFSYLTKKKFTCYIPGDSILHTPDKGIYELLFYMFPDHSPPASTVLAACFVFVSRLI